MSRPLDELPLEPASPDTIAEGLEPRRRVIRAVVATIAVAVALLAVATASDAVLDPPSAATAPSAP